MPRRRCGPGRNSRHGADEVVGAVQRLDDDAELAQVVAPHVLDQLGVVASLHPDPARLGLLRPRPGRCGDRAAVGLLAGARRRRLRAHQRHRLAVEAEASRLERECRRLPWRSRSVTASAVQATTSPQNPEARSSTTSPPSPRPSAPAAPSAAARTRPGCRARTAWRRQSGAPRPTRSGVLSRLDRKPPGQGATATPTEPLAGWREDLVDEAAVGAPVRRPPPRVDDRHGVRRPARTGCPRRAPAAPDRRGRAHPRSARCGRRSRRPGRSPARSAPAAAAACHSTSNVTGTSVPWARRQRLVRIVEQHAMGLVADAPLLQRHVADVVGPHLRPA